MRAVARELGVDVSTVSYWVKHAAGQRLDRVAFANRKPGRAWNRTKIAVEQQIIGLRSKLRAGVLGEWGADAIVQALNARSGPSPARATINRVLARYGLQDGVRRIRRLAPPKGWYLPAAAAGRAEVDCFDFIEGLKIARGPVVDVLTAKSLHGGLTDAWVLAGKTTRLTAPLLLQRWKRDGRPTYAQFDNDTVFQGAHQFQDAVGAISRLCLQLGITPVFVPPLEHGMQNGIEGFNGLWQSKVWHRNTVANIPDLQRRSDRYIAAHRARHASNAQAAPKRPRMPKRFNFDPKAKLAGTIIYLRRTGEHGEVNVMGHILNVSPTWCHRLVRCEVDFSAGVIRCFGLRRTAPHEQPLLATIQYHRLDRPFYGAI